ncbi:MAG: glycosyltransferase family 39 protein, partial [Bryobacteraceae bacterium]
MIKAVIYILLGVSITGGTAVALGKLLLARLRLRLYRNERWLFSFMLGSACFSGLLFALAALHLLYKGVFLAVAALAILGAWRFGRFAEPTADPPPLPRYWKWLFWCAWIFFGAIYLCYAMAPELSPDGSTYHLGLVLTLYRAHGFIPIATDFYKNMPAGVEMLFLPAFAFGKHSAAAMVHFLFLLVLPLLIVSFGRRFRLPAAGVFAALLVFASPVAAIDGTSAYVDIGLTAVLFALFYLLQIWDQERGRSLLIAAGILSGFAFAIKYTGAAGLIYALLFVGWRRQRSGLQALKALAAVAGIAALWILPWTVKSWVTVGNPLTPFFNGLFPNPYVHPSFVETWTRNLRHYDLPSYWRLPMEVTTWGVTTNGLIGPIFLLAPFGLFALRGREGRRILFCGLLVFLPYFGNIGTRFL